MRPPRAAFAAVDAASCDESASAAGILDVVRGMVVVDDLRRAAEALAALCASPGVRPLRIKERFLEEPTAGGWRDCLVNARFADCEHVFEIQIVHRDLLVARAGLPGHAIYHVVRAASELLERCGLGCEGLERAGRVAALCGLHREPEARQRCAGTLVEMGVDASTLVAAHCFSAAELCVAGVGCEALRAARMPLSQLLTAGFSCADLKTADASDPGALLAAGYDLCEVREAFANEPLDRLVLLHVAHSFPQNLDWFRSKKWGSDAPLAQWWGVGTTAAGRVRTIELSNCDLRGTLPSTLGQLDQLARLSLANNQHLCGELPRELAQCALLEELDVSPAKRLTLGAASGRLTVRACGFDPSRKSRGKVQSLLDAANFVDLGDFVFVSKSATQANNNAQNLGVNWGGCVVSSASGKAKQLGVQTGWICTSVNGASVNEILTEFESSQSTTETFKAMLATAAAAKDSITLRFCGRAPWVYSRTSSSGTEKKEDMRCFDALTAFELEQACTNGVQTLELEVNIAPRTKKRFTYDFRTMTQAPAHDQRGLTRTFKRASSADWIAALAENRKIKR